MQLYRIKMRYLVEPRDRIYVKGYGCSSFAKNIGKNLSNKYGKKILNSAKKFTTGAIKAASNTAIQKKQKQLVIELVTKLLIKKQMHHKIYITLAK